MVTEPVRAVLFDLDGTLLDSQRGIIKAFRLSFQELGLGPLPSDEEIARRIGPPFDVILPGLGYPMEADQLARFVAVYRRHYWKLAPVMSPPFDGVPELLRELAALKERVPGFVVGVATNKRTEMAVHILEDLGLAAHLDVIQGLDDDLPPKPAPDLILRALERAGATPEEALLVGDTEGDLLAARNAGVRSCLATYGYGAGSIPLGLVPDLRVDRPAQLGPWLRENLAA